MKSHARAFHISELETFEPVFAPLPVAQEDPPETRMFSPNFIPALDMLSIQVPGEDEHCNRDELSTQMSGHSHNELTLAVRVSAVRSLALWQRNAKGKGH